MKLCDKCGKMRPGFFLPWLNRWSEQCMECNGIDVVKLGFTKPEIECCEGGTWQWLGKKELSNIWSCSICNEVYT